MYVSESSRTFLAVGAGLRARAAHHDEHVDALRERVEAAAQRAQLVAQRRRGARAQRQRELVRLRRAPRAAAAQPALRDHLPQTTPLPTVPLDRSQLRGDFNDSSVNTVPSRSCEIYIKIREIFVCVLF